MGVAIKFPNINATTSAEQLNQIRSYLYDFVGQLNWALNTIESGQNGSNSIVLQKGSGGSSSSSSSGESDAVSNFSEIKALIIKSADIVEAYYEEIEKMIDLSGRYVAQADFGEEGVARYIKDTKMSIDATSESLTQNYYQKETIDDIDDRVGGIEDAIRTQEGYIRTGNVGSYWDENALGMEIGEFDTEDGKTDKRYARMTSYGLELFGSSKDVPVAYVRQDKLYITNAEITGTLKIGGYRIDTSNGLAFKWVGR